MFYQKHLFFCVNQRAEGRKCCGGASAQEMRDYVKGKLKAQQLAGKGKIRANTAGCLGRCAQGPVLVVYPEGVWYTYRNTADLDEIIEQHIIGGKVVERLVLPDPD